MDIAFGPVPSRRLGHSLGINNIPPKHCSYSCIYCPARSTRRRKFGARSRSVWRLCEPEVRQWTT